MPYALSNQQNTKCQDWDSSCSANNKREELLVVPKEGTTKAMVEIPTENTSVSRHAEVASSASHLLALVDDAEAIGNMYAPSIDSYVAMGPTDAMVEVSTQHTSVSTHEDVASDVASSVSHLLAQIDDAETIGNMCAPSLDSYLAMELNDGMEEVPTEHTSVFTHEDVASPVLHLLALIDDVEAIGNIYAPPLDSYLAMGVTETEDPSIF